MFSNDQPLVANQVSIPDFPDNFPDFIELFNREYRKLIDSVNSKEGALYLPYESATFQTYFTPSNPQEMINVYRKVYDFGPLPNNTVKSVSHGIEFNSLSRLTRMYGAATNPDTFSYLPLPFASVDPNENISLEADQSVITIETGIDYSSYVNVTVVIEYLKGQ